jgi:outer membrane protein TolC
MLAVICFAITLAGAEPPAPALGTGASLDRQALVEAVLAANPGHEAARAAVTAVEASRSRAGLLDDPMVFYGMAPASLAGGVDFGQELRVSQRLSYPERRRLVRAAAGFEATKSLADVTGLEADLAAMAGGLFADYYLVTRELEVTARHHELVERLKQAATGRYAAGLAQQSEPLRAEVELGHLHHRTIELEAEREIVVARINALLHRPSASPLPPPPPDLAGPTAEEPPGDALAAEALAARALAQRPQLGALDAEIEARRAEVALAALSGRPDLEVMASYNSMWSDSEHRFMIGVSVSPPLSKTRRASARTEAEARLAGAESEKRRLEDEVRLEVATAGARLRQSRHHVELYDSRLLPASRDEVRAAVAAFEAGKVDLAVVIEAERMLREVELDRHRVLAEAERSRSDLDRALGRPPVGGTAAREGGQP